MSRWFALWAGLAAGIVPAAALAAGWAPLAPLPEARYGAAAAVVNGGTYVVGGHDTADLSLNTMWSPTAGSWSEAAALPETRFVPAATALGGAVYVVGGFSTYGWPLASALRFDPAPATWTPLADLPEDRAAAGAAALNGSVYVAGGEGDYGVFLSSAYRYNPSAGAWSAIAPLPTPRSGPAVAAFGGRVYVIGGISTGPPLATVEAFDPTSATWSTAARLPERLWQPAAAAFDGRLWVMGGQDSTFNPSPHVYSLGSDGAWRAEAALPTALAAPAAAADTSGLVVAGGQDPNGPSAASFLMRPAPPPAPATAPDTLAVDVTVDPATFNPASQGRWIQLTLDATSWSVADLDPASLRLLGSPIDPAAPVSLTDVDGDGALELVVHFPRSAVAALPPGPARLCVSGRTSGGVPVAGCGSMRVLAGPAGVAAGRHLSLAVRPGAITLILTDPAPVTLDIFDLQGRRVERLLSGDTPAGQTTIAWPGAGRAIRSGVYLAQLASASERVSIRVVTAR